MKSKKIAIGILMVALKLILDVIGKLRGHKAII